MKKERKAVKIMGADSVLYAIFPIPRALLYILEPYPGMTIDWLSKVFLTLWASTAIMKPILLITFQDKYRAEIRNILKHYPLVYQVWEECSCPTTCYGSEL